jgi:hypothetical protein
MTPTLCTLQTAQVFFVYLGILANSPQFSVFFSLFSGRAGLSLGTSDTLFLWLEDEDGENAEEESIRPGKLGHIWPNPVDDDAYMALLW